jgi:hypothetical protein
MHEQKRAAGINLVQVARCVFMPALNASDRISKAPQRRTT